MDHLCYCCLVFLLCFRVRLFIDALWSPAGKGLTSWPPFVMSNCEVADIENRTCKGKIYVHVHLLFNFFFNFFIDTDFCQKSLHIP